ncbi:MAG: carboxypeptidase-like regulatory domain-containing protein, partial [Acholeplasmatales bacterium]|nr:carboxypeptidase-like regulatory domain-containing protein [Acholeplasmatales bacterium]
SVLYGTLPVYLGATPTKPSTEEFDYVFNGWSPLVVNVIGEATYNALYNEVTRSYVISFNNYDSAVLQSSSVLYGTLPVYAGLTPTKPSTAEFDYTFNGWSPSVVNVIGEATYTALYEAVTRSYTIIFKNYDNTVLQSEVLLYGTSVVYAGATPTKASDEIFDYVFDSWDSEITLVSGDATYTATYNSILITFIVTIDDAPYEVIKGEQAPRPLNDPAPEFGYRFIGYYENESLYDFSSPVTSDITLVSKFEEIILSVKGTVNSVNGLLDYASVQINSLVILTIDGLFEGTIEYDTEFSAIFSKDGYITKTVYFDIEDFVSDEFDAGEIELISNYIVLGSYGTGSVTFNAITEVSRGLKGIYFKTTFNTNDLLETDGIDFFVSIGEAERTVRNINDWCISLRADGRIYIYHYPNNVKILLSSGLDSFPIGLKVSWISLTSSTDLYAYIPYALFSGLDGLDVLNYNDVIGLASTIYNLNGTPYQALNRADLLGASNTAVVAQGNPKDFLRLSLYNELYNANGNYNTVVWGNIGISGVNVSLGTLSVISSSTGAYRFEYNRLSNTPINLEFTKVYYDLLSHPVVFSNLSLYNIGSLTLESQSASITGTVIDLENSNPLENVTVTISNLTVHTNALGEFEINGIINNQNYTLTVSLEDYSVYQFSATQAFLASGNTYLEVSLVSIYAEYQIEGYISNINGDVSGANITVSGTEISVVSGPSGYFTIPSLVVNNYVLVVSCATYLTTSFSLLTSAIQSGTSFIYDMGNLDIALDYYDFGDTGNVTTTNKFNIKGTRNKDGLLFYATTTTTPFPSSGVGIYLQVGYPTINGRTDESFLFMFVPKSPTDVNARLSIYNYPLAQKTTLANHGVTFDWDYTSGAAGKFFIPFAYFNTILPSLNMLNTDTFGITFTIDGNPGSGSQTTLWYKTESEFLGYSMTTEVVRDRPADMLRFDRYNVLSALDNGYFDFNTLKYYTELSQAYNPQVEFSLENLASVNNATYALETVAANAVIFSDRAYYFKLFGVTAGQGVVNAVVGLNYYKVPIAGTTYTVDKAGYIILGVPNSSGSSYPALRVSVAEAGWIQVFYSMYPVGTLTDNMNYCVKYVNLGDTINFGQFVIPFFIKAV